MSAPQLMMGSTSHVRGGDIANRFTHAVDYVLIDPEDRRGPRLFSRNRFNVLSVHDRDHGGRRGDGKGAPWAWEVLRAHGYRRSPRSRLRLLTQPRVLGHVFNPVSFWLVLEDEDLRAVIAEVNNTFGDRHSYLCAHDGFTPIRPADAIVADKVFHVSPFLDIRGSYAFRFAANPERIAIRIEHRDADVSLLATLSGRIIPMTSRAVLVMLLRRPLSSVRTIVLIHWQALRLKLKGARYRPHPQPPLEEVSR
ncbi:DUF1365 domain-containing protein [Sulfitobacter sp. LCG007]